MLPIQFLPIKFNFNKGGNEKEFIVVHDTGNPGATAYNHFKYFGGGNRGASAHYFVDEENIVQIIDDNDRAWHTGKQSYNSKNGCGNDNSIGIEMCLIGNDIDKELDNTIDLTVHLMKKHNIPLSKVVRHFDCSGKICPRSMSKNNWAKWKEFRKKLESRLKGEIDMTKEEVEQLVADKVEEALNPLTIYEVYQGSNHLKNFADKDRAIKEALRWKGSRVVLNKDIIWKFENSYQVLQHKTHLGYFASKDQAIKEGKKWRNSHIVQNGKIVWRF